MNRHMTQYFASALHIC